MKHGDPSGKNFSYVFIDERSPGYVTGFVSGDKVSILKPCEVFSWAGASSKLVQAGALLCAKELQPSQICSSGIHL